MVTRDAAVRPRVFHRHAVAQQAVKSAIRLHQRGRRHAQHLAQGIFPRLLRNGRVEPSDGIAQAAHQHHIRKRCALRCRFAGRE